FNVNCVGDTFQTMNIPTILFEAGHFHDDYNREEVRELMFQSLWVGLVNATFDEVLPSDEKNYFKIPQNEKLFYDIIIRNAKLKVGGTQQVLDIALQYEERLNQDRVTFIPIIEKISDLSGFFGHKEIEVDGQLVFFD